MCKPKKIQYNGQEKQKPKKRQYNGQEKTKPKRTNNDRKITTQNIEH